ncbi:hypothetical protein PVAP13_2KG240700 [Panicum virgatum]|uniref:Receptor kinase-like protein Xa21 n=1 Tax=Panicum virgatum TaxID=38727 RepID=A0A8T0W4V0_PANVG|nr:hypothetical protein PVAP13_2KG240700 [Panicum virgatum]
MVGAGSFLLVPLFLSLVASTNSALSSGIATNIATDHLALLFFKSLIRLDPSQALVSWGNNSIPLCQWRGVTCGSRGSRRGRVTELELENLSLAGAISSSVANLTFLRRLHLPGNNLQGKIPRELAALSNLESIVLFQNMLEGEIPHELGSMHNLKVLNVSYNKLTGSIPTSLGNLANLEILYIAHNDLTGEIPTEIGNLVKLSKFSLSTNQLRGSVPISLGNLSSLTVLILHTNNLTGSIPPLQNLSFLTVLALGTNDLTGCIPSQLGNLTSLVILDLRANYLTGSIPESLGNLNILESLSLPFNNFTGSIPNSIGNLLFLKTLDLDNNELEGPLPPALFNLSYLELFTVQGNNYLNGSFPPDNGNRLPHLEKFLIDYNQFHGPIPTFLCNSSMLQMFEAAQNLLTGTIPSCLGTHLKRLSSLVLAKNQIQATQDADWGFLASLANCSDLQLLDLSYNRLEGEIPNSVGNLSRNLQRLSLRFNNITGKITEELASLVGINMLSLSGNHLEGNIPSSLGRLQGLNELYLQMNDLSGSIPTTIGNLTKLLTLDLDGNMLNGSIPSSLNGCPLQRLDLSHNKLEGPIPKELFLISTLSDFMDIQSNLLTGILPIEVGNLKNLGELDFSGNQIYGEIPGSLGACQSLQYLNASHNNLEGTIPLSLEQMKGLLVVDLSHNNLSGNIPEFFAKMRGLSIFNISFNNFKGQVPEDGIFSNASSTTIIANDGLCGGVPQLKLPPCTTHTTKRPYFRLIVAVSVGSTCLFVICLMLIFFHWNKKKKDNHQTSTISEHHVRVSYAELSSATDSFSSGNLIGTGSFGSVFKGKIMIEELQVTVAVKVLNLQQHGASQSFAAECETLRCVRHRNLVKILTVCSSVDLRGIDFKALVFEFLPNGNLERWLHQSVEEDGEYKVLDLVKRLDISIDVASALEYLHQHKPLPIIHCDIKPSNILLNDDMVAHVGDFGLARFYHEDSNDTSEKSSAWARMRGTIGYAAPEYGLGNEVSILGDVYSYGILLLEMFTGRRPTDSKFGDELSLHKYVQMALPERVINIADQQLLSNDGDGQGISNSVKVGDARIVCITSVLQIGIACSNDNPTDRLQIRDALKELQAIRDKFGVSVQG